MPVLKWNRVLHGAWKDTFFYADVPDGRLIIAIDGVLDRFQPNPHLRLNLATPVRFYDVWPDGQVSDQSYHYGTQEEAKKAADLFFIKRWPVLAMAMAVQEGEKKWKRKPRKKRSRRNPEAEPASRPVPQPIRTGRDEKAILRVRRFLSQAYHPDTLRRTLGREPSAKEVAEANRMQQLVNTAVQDLNWEFLNKMLVPFHRGEKPPPLGYELVTERARQGKPVRPATAAIDYGELKRIAEAVIPKVFGPTLRPRDMEDHVQAIILRWFEQTGGAGIPTVEAFRSIAREIRKERAQQEREEVVGEEREWGAAGAYARPDVEVQEERLWERWAETAEPSAAQAVQVVRGRIERMLKSKNPMERSRALIIGLHLGLKLLPNQPATLARRVRLLPDEAPYMEETIWGDKQTRFAPTAYYDLTIYHRPTERPPEPCPTCARIARFLRAPGLDGPRAGEIVDAFLVQLDQETGYSVLR